MTGDFITVIALVVCTVLGAVVGFAVARWMSREAAAGKVGVAQPAPVLESIAGAEASSGTKVTRDHDVAERKPSVALPAVSQKRMKVSTTIPAADLPANLQVDLQVDLEADLTDAEIDALPPEVPVPVRRPYRSPHSRTRNFDKL